MHYKSSYKWNQVTTELLPSVPLWDITQVPQYLIMYFKTVAEIAEIPEDEPLVYPLHNGIEISGLGIDQRATKLERIRLLHKKASKLVEMILKYKIDIDDRLGLIYPSKSIVNSAMSTVRHHGNCFHTCTVKNTRNKKSWLWPKNCHNPYVFILVFSFFYTWQFTRQWFNDLTICSINHKSILLYICHTTDSLDEKWILHILTVVQKIVNTKQQLIVLAYVFDLHFCLLFGLLKLVREFHRSGLHCEMATRECLQSSMNVKWILYLRMLLHVNMLCTDYQVCFPWTHCTLHYTYRGIKTRNCGTVKSFTVDQKQVSIRAVSCFH